MKLVASTLVAGLLALGTGAAHATVAPPCSTCGDPLSGTFSITVYEAASGSAFNALPTALSTYRGQTYLNGAAAITASFTYTGALNFSDDASQNRTPSGDKNSNFFPAGQISNYSGSGTVTIGPRYNPQTVANFNSLQSFLNSSGSVAGYDYGSLYKIDLGVLAAGSTVTFSHDDGASIFQNGVQIGTSTTGATTQVTDSVILTSTGDTILWYARENGTPSVLCVTDPTGNPVPEPASMALLGGGLAAVGMIRRRRKA